jgi:hypothetical protein
VLVSTTETGSVASRAQRCLLRIHSTTIGFDRAAAGIESNPVHRRTFLNWLPDVLVERIAMGRIDRL